MKSKEIKRIIEKGIEKLTVAEELYTKGHYDDASSRAYYAVYHCITAVLFIKRLTYSTQSQTIGAFNKEYIKTNIFPNDFTSKIQKLFDNRQLGDYDVYKKITKKMAEIDIKNAKVIIDKIIEYINSI